MTPRLRPTTAAWLAVCLAASCALGQAGPAEPSKGKTKAAPKQLPLLPPRPGRLGRIAQEPAVPPEMLPDRSRDANTIRICWQEAHGFRTHEWLADGYKTLLPAVEIVYLERGKRMVDSWLAGECDLYPDSDAPPIMPIIGPTIEERQERAFGRKPEQAIYAYYPTALLVNPSRPAMSVSMETLRTFATKGGATWRDLGYARADAIGLLAYGPRIDYMLGLQPGESTMNGLLLRTRLGIRDNQDPSKIVGEDANALLIAPLNPARVASGLRTLSILAASGEATGPADARAVADGRYPLRTAMLFYIYPKASAAARKFAQWCTTPEAAKAMVAGREDMADHTSQTPFYAHVSLARTPGVSKPAEARPRPVAAAATSVAASAPAAAPVRFDEPIAGAVAVLPAVKLSLYFVMAGPAELANYEDIVARTIQADKRLKLVDRTMLGRVMQERAVALAGESQTPMPMIAADVFVLLTVTTDAGQATLHVQTVHGATAALLGRLDLPIDPTAAVQLRPPLDRQVAAWWPGVLKRLKDIRDLPVWTVVDVYPGPDGDPNVVREVERAMSARLGEIGRVFPAERAPIGPTQQEMLMWLMGMTRGAARFSPLADYMVEGRLAGKLTLELRLRRGDLHVVKTGKVAGSSAAELAAAAGAWLAAAVAEHPDRPDARRLVLQGEDDDWAKLQAKQEFALGEKQLADLMKPYEDRAAFHSSMSSPEWIEARSHFRSAAQLDPAWDEASYMTLSLASAYSRSLLPTGLNRIEDPLDAARLYEQFLRTFPASAHCCDVRRRSAERWDSIMEWSFHPMRWERPVDPNAAFDFWLGATLRHLDDELSSYRTLESLSMYFAVRIRTLAGYFCGLGMPEARQDEIIRLWARKYDGKPGVPRSDFIRLIMLARRKKEAEFLKLLNKLQQDMPDPKNPEWAGMGLQVNEARTWVFPVIRRENDSFWKWLREGGKPGNLPYEGYDPNTVRRFPRR
jgi:hypothetical protein